jgi:hypothetical protein
MVNDPEGEFSITMLVKVSGWGRRRDAQKMANEVARHLFVTVDKDAEVMVLEPTKRIVYSRDEKVTVQDV